MRNSTKLRFSSFPRCITTRRCMQYITVTTQVGAAQRTCYTHSFHDGRPKSPPHGVGGGSATARERRNLSMKWEDMFYGRVFSEPGMRERFNAATQAEDNATEAETHRQHDGVAGDDVFTSPWPADSTAPLEAFLALRPSHQQQYILSRLQMGERRIRYAADYGSLLIMQHLNYGEMMVKEAAHLLKVLGWSSEELDAAITDVLAVAVNTRFDFDL